MTRRRPPSLAAPLLAWSDLAVRTAQMLAASAHVIGHRTRRSNSAAQIYSMGTEKVQEASQAMARHWRAMQNRAQLGSWSQWAALVSSGLTPFHARALKNSRRARRR